MHYNREVVGNRIVPRAVFRIMTVFCLLSVLTVFVLLGGGCSRARYRTPEEIEEKDLLAMLTPGSILETCPGLKAEWIYQYKDGHVDRITTIFVRSGDMIRVSEHDDYISGEYLLYFSSDPEEPFVYQMDLRSGITRQFPQAQPVSEWIDIPLLSYEDQDYYRIVESSRQEGSFQVSVAIGADTLDRVDTIEVDPVRGRILTVIGSPGDPDVSELISMKLVFTYDETIVCDDTPRMRYRSE